MIVIVSDGRDSDNEPEFGPSPSPGTSDREPSFCMRDGIKFMITWQFNRELPGNHMLQLGTVWHGISTISIALSINLFDNDQLAANARN